MRPEATVLAPQEDPAAILGIPPEASESDIRAAYLRKVKEHPPEKDPEAFERIRDAYGILKDPRRRIELTVLEVDPDAPIAALVKGGRRERRFVGPEAWLAVLKERRP